MLVFTSPSLAIRWCALSCGAEMGQCAEWNPAMEKASGIKRHAALGRILVGDLFGAELRLRVDERTRLMMVLNRAIVGHSTKGHSLAFINAQVREEHAAGRSFLVAISLSCNQRGGLQSARLKTGSPQPFLCALPLA